MADGAIRFYLETICDEEGNTIAQVMERSRPFADATCIGRFTHEWRACKRIAQLKEEAHQRGERVVYLPGENTHSWM